MYTIQAAGRKRRRIPIMASPTSNVGAYDDELIKPFNTEEFNETL
jgi:hypothetical protein